MADRIVQVADGFWNIQGSFKIAGFLDIGTQASLVRLKSGRFVMLSSYTLAGAVADEVMKLTDQGHKLEAVIHTHPFHTVHVKKLAQMFPNARQFGSKRHHEKAPEVKWEPLLVDDPKMHALYAEDLSFTVPRGVDFISANQNLHFSSVLVVHKATRTMHVDDTLMWNPLPIVGGLGFHMTLKSVLQPRAGAAAEFRAWAQELITLCESVDHICTAHARPMPALTSLKATTPELVRLALQKEEKLLSAHEKKFG